MAETVVRLLAGLAGLKGCSTTDVVSVKKHDL
jgi:hypothetical protein